MNSFKNVETIKIVYNFVNKIFRRINDFMWKAIKAMFFLVNIDSFCNERSSAAEAWLINVWETILLPALCYGQYIIKYTSLNNSQIAYVMNFMVTIRH